MKKTILDNHLVKKGEHIIIGLSGGPDSVCLFFILKELREELGFTLHAVHVNHKLRPGAAEEDQSYVEALCEKFGIPCRTFTFDIHQIAKTEGISSEDAGRQARYESFYQVAASIGSQGHSSAVKIAVAQNMNDQAETLLMRIMRGTGTDGLSGIEYQRPGKNGTTIIRPLLDITRQEIEEYCQSNNLNPRIDLTNLEPIYTRNKIRLELLPFMQENFNTGIMDALNRLSKIAKEDKSYFNQLVVDLMDKTAEITQDCVTIPLSVLMEQHPAVRRRMIMKCFERIGLSKDITSVHLEQAEQLLRSKKTSSTIDFSAGFAMKLSYDTVALYKKTESFVQGFEYEINMDGITNIFELNSQIGVKILRGKDWEPEKSKSRIINQSLSFCYMSYDKIKGSNCKLTLRTRRPGDYIQPLGMKGRKKLQDFFVDEKIKKEDRERIPLLCMGSEVLWVIGTWRIGENYKVKENTEQIIVLEYRTKI